MSCCIKQAVFKNTWRATCLSNSRQSSQVRIKIVGNSIHAKECCFLHQWDNKLNMGWKWRPTTWPGECKPGWGGGAFDNVGRTKLCKPHPNSKKPSENTHWEADTFFSITIVISEAKQICNIFIFRAFVRWTWNCWSIVIIKLKCIYSLEKISLVFCGDLTRELNKLQF